MNPFEEDELFRQRQQKQVFLKQEIIEKGYDGAQFAEYLNGIKAEGGGNIDIWAFNELKDLVERFKTISAVQEPVVTEENLRTEPSAPQIDYTYEEPQNITYTEPESVMYNEQPSMVSDTKSYVSKTTHKARTNPDIPNTSMFGFEENKDEEPSHVPEESNPKRSRGMSQDNKTDQPHEGRERDESYSGTLNVKLGEITQLSDAKNKNTEVVIQGYEQVKSGLFSTTHIQFLIKTLPFGWEVKRRFSDFFWLRTTLLKLHPGVLVPPIPKKTNKFKPDFLKKRMYFLQRFLNACILNDELRADKYFLSFLSTTNENEYKNKKKESEKKPRFTRIKDITTVTGQIPLEINKGIKHHASSFGELCASTDPIYSKIKKLSKQLIVDFEQVSNTLFSLAECYAGLYSLASNFNKHTEVGKNLHLEDIYMTINNLTVAWAEQTLSQTENIQKNFSYFYKYAKYENESFKEVLENRMKCGLEYLAKKKDLMTRKEKLFQAKDISKWEIPPQKLKEISKDTLLKDKKLACDLMLPKETAGLNEVRNTFAYYNAQCFNDLDRGLREKCKQYAKNFSDFGKAQSSIMQQLESKWTDLLGHFGESTISLGSRGGEIKTRATVMPRKQDEMVRADYEDD